MNFVFPGNPSRACGVWESETLYVADKEILDRLEVILSGNTDDIRSPQFPDFPNLGKNYSSVWKECRRDALVAFSAAEKRDGGVASTNSSAGGIKPVVEGDETVRLGFAEGQGEDIFRRNACAGQFGIGFEAEAFVIVRFMDGPARRAAGLILEFSNPWKAWR